MEGRFGVSQGRRGWGGGRALVKEHFVVGYDALSFFLFFSLLDNWFGEGAAGEKKKKKDEEEWGVCVCACGDSSRSCPSQLVCANSDNGGGGRKLARSEFSDEKRIFRLGHFFWFCWSCLPFVFVFSIEVKAETVFAAHAAHMYSGLLLARYWKLFSEFLFCLKKRLLFLCAFFV